MNCKNGNHSCNSCGERKCGSKHNCHSADMVEVVRCCDCKYCEVVIIDIIDEPKYFCTRMVGSIPIDPTDYCSHGERIQNEQR